MEKMTKREFYEVIIQENEDNERLIEFAKHELNKMDRALEKRRSKPTKAQIENAPLIAEIVENILREKEFITASEIGETMELSVQKASAVMRQAVAEGKAEVKDVKVKGKGTQKGYKLPSEGEIEVE